MRILGTPTPSNSTSPPTNSQPLPTATTSEQSSKIWEKALVECTRIFFLDLSDMYVFFQSFISLGSAIKVKFQICQGEISVSIRL